MGLPGLGGVARLVLRIDWRRVSLNSWYLFSERVCISFETVFEERGFGAGC
jgi:hypothetical protein